MAEGISAIEEARALINDEEYNDNGPKGSRNWCFTFFYYMWEDIEYFLDLVPHPAKGTILQEEKCPHTGQPHLQGFIRFQRGYTRAQVKALLTPTMQHIHLEPAKSPFDAVEYCRKGDTRMGECYEEGDLVFSQGVSHDLASAYELIARGCSTRQLIRAFPVPCIRHVRGLQWVKSELDAERDVSFRTLKVFVITGHSGAGKTRAAYKFDPSLYKLDRSASGRDIWFDGYDGQRTLLIDDFYGWIPYGQLLNLLDGYPLRLPTKGGHARAAYTTVIITSNAVPSYWYRARFPDGLSAALARRITGWFAILLPDQEEEIAMWLAYGPHIKPPSADDTRARVGIHQVPNDVERFGMYASLLARNFNRDAAVRPP